MATKTGYFHAVLSDKGQPIQASVTIFIADTETKATIWADAGGTIVKDNPFQTDVLGRFQFFANPGFYDLNVYGVGITTFKIESVYVSSVISMERLYNLESILQEGFRMGHGEDFGEWPWTDLGTQYSQSYIYSLCYLGNGIALAGTGGGGKILRHRSWMIGHDHQLLSARHLNTTAASPVLGDIITADSASWKRKAGNTTTTRKFLRQVGTGSASAEPDWDTLQAGDLPAHAWGNLIYVAPGTNTLSTALAAISDGDVLLLGKGTYIQTAALTVPATVTDFGVIGAGMGSTLIRFDSDVEGIAQMAVRVHHCILRGFRMVMNATSTTRKAICLWGATHNGTVNPRIHISGVSIERGDNGKRWGRGINLINAFESLIENYSFRGNPSTGSGVAGDAVYLESCVWVKVVNSHICEAGNAIYLEKAGDALIEGAVKHGCEGNTVQNVDVYICNRGVYLGEKSLDNRIVDCNIEPVYINAIEEGAYGVSCGYNTYCRVWAGWVSDTTTSSHLFWLRMHGGKIENCTLNANTIVQNLVCLSDDRNYITITNCTLRFCPDNAYAILMSSVNYSIIGFCIAEGSGEDDDVNIMAGSDNNRLIGNIFPKGVLNNGAGNDIV